MLRSSVGWKIQRGAAGGGGGGGGKLRSYIRHNWLVTLPGISFPSFTQMFRNKRAENHQSCSSNVGLLSDYPTADFGEDPIGGNRSMEASQTKVKQPWLTDVHQCSNFRHPLSSKLISSRS